MPVEDKARIIDLCSGNNIAFLQALIPKDRQNEIQFEPILRFGSLRDYLNMSPQLFTFDSMETKHVSLPTIKVNSLSEIPYYARQKEDYDVYYEKRKASSRENMQVLATTERKSVPQACESQTQMEASTELNGKSHETS